MKIVNPLHYPVAVLLGAIALLLGVRQANISKIIMLLIASAIAFIIATLIQSLQSKNPALDREIQTVKQQAQLLAVQSQSLREESEKLLTNANQLELLTTIQYACDRAKELPAKVNLIINNLQSKDSLLSPADIQNQLTKVRAKQSKSSGMAYQQLEQLANSLERNLELAKQEQDTSQTQIFALSNQVVDAAGVLQKLQNQIRTSNLNDTEKINELNELSNELNNIQENVDLLRN